MQVENNDKIVFPDTEDDLIVSSVSSQLNKAFDFSTKRIQRLCPTVDVERLQNQGRFWIIVNTC